MFRGRFINSTFVVAICALSTLGQTTLPTTTSQPAVETLPELRPILSSQAKRQAAVKRIDRFVEHVANTDAFTDSAKQAVRSGWQQFRDDEHPEDFLTAGIAILSQPFKQGMNALANEDYATADSALAEAMKQTDPYIALHAQALAARSLVEQDRLEAAQAVLEPLALLENSLHEQTFLEAEVDFLLGYCYLANLDYDNALKTLRAFEYQHPGAPERFQLPVKQMLQELRVRQADGLGDVSDLMVYAGRRLYNGQSSKPVQIRQKQAVELLDQLIRKADEQERPGSGKSDQSKGKGKGKSGAPKGNDRSSGPANESSVDKGKSRIGSLDKMNTARPGDVWGTMRPEERERIMQSLKQNFPAQYRQLVEQYYKQLAKEQ